MTSSHGRLSAGMLTSMPRTGSSTVVPSRRLAVEPALGDHRDRRAHWQLDCIDLAVVVSFGQRGEQAHGGYVGWRCGRGRQPRHEHRCCRQLAVRAAQTSRGLDHVACNEKCGIGSQMRQLTMLGRTLHRHQIEERGGRRIPGCGFGIG